MINAYFLDKHWIIADTGQSEKDCARIYSLFE